MGVRTSHEFDWKAFSFTCKVSAAVLLVGVGAPAGIARLEPYFTPPPPSLAAVPQFPLSTTTPQRVINALNIEEAVPKQGKFIVADLSQMRLTLFEDGTTTAQYPILSKGKPGTPYETPAGQYRILTKEEDHFNYAEGVHMPYSMEFYGNYFIHGWPTYADGTPVASTYSGGCIRLDTADAAAVYDFAQRGGGVFVYDPRQATSPALALAPAPLPPVSASSYLVADLDTGDVYAEENAQAARPIASVTKLMTALVANETIMFDQPIDVPRGILRDQAVATDTQPETFLVGDLLYPLLMESNNNVADALASRYGTPAFVSWMNRQAKALGMALTTFADPSGASAGNVSTPEDLYRLAVYLSDKKSFVWKVTRAPQKTITSRAGDEFTYRNFNGFSGLSSFIGGKVGHTEAAQDTMLSVFSMPVGGQMRRVAIIVLGSGDYTSDTRTLATWFGRSARASGTACAACAEPAYRKIEL